MVVGLLGYAVCLNPVTMGMITTIFVKDFYQQVENPLLQCFGRTEVISSN